MPVYRPLLPVFERLAKILEVIMQQSNNSKQPAEEEALIHYAVEKQSKHELKGEGYTDASDGIAAIETLYPREVTPNVFSVLSLSEQAPRAYTVNIGDHSCTCETEPASDHGVCPHVAIALYTAGSGLDAEVAQTMIEQEQQAINEQVAAKKQAASPDKQSSDSPESGELQREDVNGHTEARQELADGWENEVYRHSPHLANFVQDAVSDPAEVHSDTGIHAGEPGMTVRWYKPNVGERDHEWLTAKIKELDGSTYHGGFTDEGCTLDGCESPQDGAGYWHIPTDSIGDI